MLAAAGCRSCCAICHLREGWPAHRTRRRSNHNRPATHMEGVQQCRPSPTQTARSSAAPQPITSCSTTALGMGAVVRPPLPPAVANRPAVPDAAVTSPDAPVLGSQQATHMQRPSRSQLARDTPRNGQPIVEGGRALLSAATACLALAKRRRWRRERSVRLWCPLCQADSAALRHHSPRPTPCKRPSRPLPLLRIPPPLRQYRTTDRARAHWPPP